VTKLIEKSAEGKLRWTRLSDAYEAQTPDGVLSVYINIGNAGQQLRGKWSEFSVKINGEEIIRATNDPNPFALLAGISFSPLTFAIDNLVSYLEVSRRAELKQALGILDSL